MEKILYIVRDIIGDYAILVDEKGDENNVAMFFLPENIAIGSKLCFENFEYELLN